MLQVVQPANDGASIQSQDWGDSPRLRLYPVRTLPGTTVVVVVIIIRKASSPTSPQDLTCS